MDLFEIGNYIIGFVLLMYAFNTTLQMMFGLTPDRSNFYCGLYGFNGAKAPNEDKLKILGMYNLPRGDDSCGIYWDGKLYKGVNLESNVLRFYEKNTFKPIKEKFTVIGHNRKSTVGKNEIDNCHPFGYWLDGDTSKIPYAVGAHNGTIRNREELKKKYDATPHVVDSAEILEIIINSKSKPKNISVLEEYEGFGAFMWSFPETDDLYIFRGKSEQGEDLTGERPLFYWKKAGEDMVYISSIKDSLLAICDDDEKIIREFEPNRIHHIKAGKMMTYKKEYDRSARNKTTTYASSSSSSTTSSVATTSNVGNGIATTFGPKKKGASEIFLNFPKSALEKYEKKSHPRENNGDAFLETEPYIDVNELIRITNNKDFKGKIIYCGGQYRKNGHILGAKLKEGEVLKIDANGYLAGHKNYDNKTSKEFYFWNGWTCLSHESMTKVIKMFKDGSIFDEHVKTRFCLYKLQPFFDCIIFNPGVPNGHYSMGRQMGGNPQPYHTGKFEPLFNQGKIYFFNNGYFKSVVLQLEPFMKLDPSKALVEISAAEIEKKEKKEASEAEKETLQAFYNDAMENLNVSKGMFEEPVEFKSNEATRIKMYKWLNESYIYLKDHYEHLTKKKLPEEILY